MKGVTNLQFLYQNAKFSEAYLDNMYRRKLDSGKYVIDDRLSNLNKINNEVAPLENIKHINSITNKKMSCYINQIRKNKNYLRKFILASSSFIIYILATINFNNNINLNAINNINVYITFLTMIAIYNYYIDCKKEF